MGKLMYLKKESGYDFAPAIVKIIETRKYGGKVQIIFTNNDLYGFAYSKLWTILLEDIRKLKFLEFLKYYFKRKVKN